MTTPGPIERAVSKYLAYFEEAKRLHLEVVGQPMEMNKSTDQECLTTVFNAILARPEAAAAFVAEALHLLVWGQCLGNGNHRTSVLFLRNFLRDAGVRYPQYDEASDALPRFEKSMNQWTGRSQALIRRRGEPGFAQARLEPRHREITREWVLEMLGDQSDVLMMVGPQRLISFIS